MSQEEIRNIELKAMDAHARADNPNDKALYFALAAAASALRDDLR
jgi:hypothetical protein